MKQAMTPEEIKEKKPYLTGVCLKKNMTTSAKSCCTVCQTTRKRAFTRQCGPSTVPTKSPSQCCDCSPTRMTEFARAGEGAGVVDIDDGQAVVFKAESHNHPSTVEPYQARLLVSAGFYATSSVWVRGQSLP